MVAPVCLFALVEHELDSRDARVLNGWPEQTIEELLRSKHHQAHVEPHHVSMSLARERFTRGTELVWTDKHDLGQLQRVLQFQQHLFGPAGRVFDALLALLVSQLPQQEERNEDERDGEENVRLDNVQKMKNQRDRSREDAGDGIPVVPMEPVFHAGLRHSLLLPRRTRFWRTVPYVTANKRRSQIACGLLASSVKCGALSA